MLKSTDGTEHRAHRNVLSAASSGLECLLSEGFREGEKISSGEAVEIAASAGAVAGLLDYIYGGEPLVDTAGAVELLRLADAYGLPHLAEAAEAELLSSLDNATALQILQQSSTLATLKLLESCEDHIAHQFETCMQEATFLELSASQLSRLLKRDDLEVKREEVVLQGLWKWLTASKDRMSFLGPMLQLVDFASLSMQSLEKIRHVAQNVGNGGFYLQAEADAALKKRLAPSAGNDFRPKRRRLSHWSAELGAHAGGEEVHMKGQLDLPENLFWHEGWIYISDRRNRRIVRWKPGTDQVQVVAGQGAQVNGVNDLGDLLFVAVSPKSEIVVADIDNNSLVKFEDGRGEVMIEKKGVPFFSPNGTLYIFTMQQVQRLDGATSRPVIASDDLPQEQQFSATRCAASQDEVNYLSDRANKRILRLSPGDSEVTVVGTAAAESRLWGLTLGGDTVYVADDALKKIWSFRPGESIGQIAFDLSHIDGAHPIDVLVQDGSLFVLHNQVGGGFVSQHALPAPIDLEAVPT